MLRFTDEIRQPVVLADGSAIGVLRDLTLILADGDAVVDRLAVGSRFRISHLLPWSAVASFEHSQVELLPGAEALLVPVDPTGVLPLESDEMLIGRDVLDAQIVDVGGQRLVRIADILLTRLPGERLRVVAADVGFGSVCQRMGLRRLAARWPTEAVAWEDLHLTSARGHVVQLATARALVHRLDAAELATLLAHVPTRSAVDLLEMLGPERAAAAIAATQYDVSRRLVLALDGETVETVLEHLPEEHARRWRPILAKPRPIRRPYRRHRGWRRTRGRDAAT